MDHQFSLFGHQPPKLKVPISAEKIRQAKEFLAKNDGKSALQVIRDVREVLENFERRITNKK